MPDGSDPGRVERYTGRRAERVRRTVHEPNRSDILKTIRKGRSPSPKPNQRTTPSWNKAIVRTNARDLRILAGQLQGLAGVEDLDGSSVALVVTGDRAGWVAKRFTSIGHLQCIWTL